MATTNPMPLTELFEQDETAWLDEMSRLAGLGRSAELDLVNLTTMLERARQEERAEVFSRLVAFVNERLNWEHCDPYAHHGYWKTRIMRQRRRLGMWLKSAMIRRYAESVLEEAYQAGRRHSSMQIEYPNEPFPDRCPWTLDELLAEQENSE